MADLPSAGPSSWPASAPPPGWYPDPWRVAVWRWWDGYRWTAHVSGTYYVAPMPERAPKGPGIKGGGIAAVGAGLGVAGGIAVAIGFAVASSGHIDRNDPWYLLASQLALWAGFLGAAVVASRRHGTGSFAADYGLSWPRAMDLWRGLVAGIAGRLPPTLVLLLIVLARDQFGTPTGAGRQVNGMTPEGAAGWIVVLVLAVVGAPVVEELFFRGLLQGAFTRRIGAVPAIFVTALVFSFAHILNEGPFAPLVIFPGALVLGYLRHRYGRLAPGMIAHSVFNALAYALLLVPGFR